MKEFDPIDQVSPTESHWKRLIAVDRCRVGLGTFVEFDGKELAVFILGDVVSVIGNSCPHAGGNLSGGDVAAGVVTCPWHQWQFDLGTGVCVDSSAAKARKYPARIRDGWVEICVELNSAAPRPAAQKETAQFGRLKDTLKIKGDIIEPLENQRWECLGNGD